jgi:hypothetical protein
MAARPNQGTASAGTPAVEHRRERGGFELPACDVGGPKGGIAQRADPAVPSVEFMLLIERVLKADLLAKVGLSSGTKPAFTR